MHFIPQTASGTPLKAAIPVGFSPEKLESVKYLN